ncbi:transcriptional regulator, deor family [hydrocarbon metagenome]|uniref:Transcriptional regulator, deor family n=1 Tax=hydrocarbon metagenome TaxID=938273 RepID=A0A0W8E8J2_9ZZZZ
MKIDRLISILVVLLNGERTQAKQLAEMFGVSVRTILRDIETINLAGIPIVTYQGAGGGIGIAEGYRIDKSVLSADDMAAIITSLKGVATTLPDHRFNVLMEKLKYPLSSSQRQILDLKTRQMIIDLSPWGGNESLKEKTALLRKATEDFKIISLFYLDANGAATERQVEPYSLLWKGRNWYLHGWCLLRQDYRLFKLSRIQEMQITDQSFEPRDDHAESMGLDNKWQHNTDLLELDLLFIPDMKNVVEECFGDDFYQQEDGSILVRTALPDNNWMYGYLLSFGAGLKVLNPPHVRIMLANIAAEIYKLYTS